MNIFQSIASIFTPQKKPTSQVNNRYGTKSGYLFSGAKFTGSSVYPSAWDLDNETIRDQSRAAYWDSTQAQAIISRLADNVVGTGLALELKPMWDLLDGVAMTDEKKHKFSRMVEQRFDLWASSTEPDAAGRWSLYQLTALEYINRMRDGESFHILRYTADGTRMSPLSIQTILPEQVMSPGFTDTDTIKSGIEIDKSGREIAIHVATDEYLTGNVMQRIPVRGTARRFVIHPIVADTLGAVRGTPLLANCIHELKKITDLTVAEIEAAVINAVLAVWVKPSADANASRALSGIQRRGTTETTGNAGTESSQTTFDKPGLIVQTLKAGEELQSFDTKRPNVNATEFIRSITKTLAASKGVPIEVLEESFNANYSASRASLLLFWRKVEIERAKTAVQYLSPIFESWFAEEVSAGRIQVPGYADSPVVRKAWTNHAWNGDKQPSIDPQKEATADDIRIAQGTTTRERVAMEYNGSDAMENINRLTQENTALAAAIAPLQPVAVATIEQPDNQDQSQDDNQDEDA